MAQQPYLHDRPCCFNKHNPTILQAATSCFWLSGQSLLGKIFLQSCSGCLTIAHLLRFYIMLMHAAAHKQLMAILPVTSLYPFMGNDSQNASTRFLIYVNCMTCQQPGSCGYTITNADRPSAELGLTACFACLKPKSSSDLKSVPCAGRQYSSHGVFIG